MPRTRGGPPAVPRAALLQTHVQQVTLNFSLLCRTAREMTQTPQREEGGGDPTVMKQMLPHGRPAREMILHHLLLERGVKLIPLEIPG